MISEKKADKRDEALDEIRDIAKNIQSQTIPKWQQYTIYAFLTAVLLLEFCVFIYIANTKNGDLTVNFLSLIQ